ncbi:hypothetical protein ACWDOR_33450 [Streptosporangium canum]|uniref:hypothetical protein n=1 Tax=Streptosporangium canum TaxID=324952 RepID=UPI0036C32ED8
MPQLVRLSAEQRDEVGQQVELGHRDRVAEAERARGLHEAQVQFLISAGQHGVQPR